MVEAELGAGMKNVFEVSDLRSELDQASLQPPGACDNIFWSESSYAVYADEAKNC